MHNLYQILGVNRDASIHAIKKAYRDKALFEHPDKGGDAKRMTLLTTAYQTLSDPSERKLFDQEWGIFNASCDTEIPLTPSDCLPSAGIAFSKSFRQQHEKFVKQCLQKPLDKKQPSSYLKLYHSDLYSCTGNGKDDLFSFIKAKGNLETKLDIGILSPEKAVEHFINFLQGDYSGKNLRGLSKAFYRKIEQLQALGQRDGYEYKLYCGIYKIFLVAVKEKTPNAMILFSLYQITEYAKHSTDETMSFMAPLLQSKYFRSLFSQALHYYWLSEESVLDESYAKAFDGQTASESLIERLKSKLSENRSASKSNDQVAKSLRLARLLFKLEKDLSKRADITTTNRAVFYREKAFHLLDWLPSLMGFADHAIAINTLFQIGIVLQKAAAQEPNSVLCMADEKLAAQIYAVAAGIAHRATPDAELYACMHSVKGLLSCHYTDSEFTEVLEALKHRALWLADLFPFYQAPQSNASFIAQEDKTLVLMRQFLHALIDKIDSQKYPVEKSIIDHSYERVFYQAYEACLKNWYKKSHDPEKEKKFRERLMQELLVNKQWTTNNINYNLNAPWSLTDLDEQGWTCTKSSILLSAKKENIPTYKTIRGAEVNYKTGEIVFILDYCEENESDYNYLLTLFDLCDLFERRITSSIFSLDPVDPDMPYHPFNEMRFAPSTLYHSPLLHTMLITDWLLKFLTVGKEVQRRDPFELRSLDKIASQLPDHLKKIIYDFHTNNHKESLNRFWIESEEVELAIDEELEKDGNVLFALANIRMVVKHHKMKRDAEGNLVDKEGEDEGWDCYVLTQEQMRELFNGRRIIEDSALIIVKESLEIIFWENHRKTHRFTLEENREDLICLSQLQRDNQEKVKADGSEPLRHRIVLKAAEKTGMPHRYSPEFIFAQEFTKHYDEFAIYFPEFGRLRELSKAVSLVNVMAAQRAANLDKVQLIKKRLNYRQLGNNLKQAEEYEYWETTRKALKELVGKVVAKQFEEWRSKFSKEKFEQKRQELFNNIRGQIGTLRFSEFSPEVKNICDRYHDSIKSDIIAEHGYNGWNSVSDRVYREAIAPKIPQIIADLQAQKKAACLKELSELFKDELTELSTSDGSYFVNTFLEGNDKPLRDYLVRYDGKLVIKKIKEDAYPEHTINTLDRALNNFEIDEILTCETGKAIKEHEQQLKVQLDGRGKLEQSFVNLGFGADTEEIDQEGACLWVPASFRHDVERGQIRTVYGGVSISGRIREHVNPRDREALLRQTRAVGKRLQRNRMVGNAISNFFREDVVSRIFPSPEFDVRENYFVPTDLGRRYLDIVVIGRADGRVAKAYEIKNGNSPYHRRQRDKDDWMLKNGVIDSPVSLRRFKIDPSLFDN